MKAKIQVFFCIFLLTVAGLHADTLHVSTQKSVFSALAPGDYKVHTVSALNTKTGQTLVIWEKHPNNHCCHSLYARMLSPAGAPVTGDLLLVSGPNTYNPSVVYNPTKNEFALVYANEVGGQLFAIYAQRLTPQGRIGGQAVKISQDNPRDGYISDYPMITFDEANNTYVVVWQRFTGRANSAPNGLQGIVLNPAFAPVSSQVMLRAEQPDGFPPQPFRIAVQPSGGRIFVIFGVLINNGSSLDYFLVKSQPDLTGVSVTKVNPTTVNLIGTSVGPAVDILLLQDGSGSIYYAHGTGIKRRRFGATGNFVGAVTPAFHPPVGSVPLNTLSVISATTGSVQKLFLFSVQRPGTGQPGKLWLQELDATGTAIGAPQTADTSETPQGSFHAIRLPRLASGTKFRMAGVYSNGNDTGLGLTLLRMLYDETILTDVGLQRGIDEGGDIGF